MNDAPYPHLPEPELLLYHYGELDASRFQAAERHLQHCLHCRENLRNLEEELALLPRPELRLDARQTRQFAEQVMQRVQRPARPWLPVAGGALAAATALGLTLVLVQPGSTPAPPPVAPPALAELELLQELELLETLELLQELELLEELGDLG